MLADKTTLQDLSIFHHEEEQSILHVLDYTETTYGRQWLRHILEHPHNSIKAIRQVQETIGLITTHSNEWPTKITNGTLMVIDRFFQSQVDTLPDQAGLVSATTYKLLHAPDYSLTRYSVKHTIDFLQGMQALVELLGNEHHNKMLQTIIESIRMHLNKPEVSEMIQLTGTPNVVQTVQFGHFILYRYKHHLYELMELYGKLDAYHSLAVAVKKMNLVFPAFEEGERPFVSADGLYHILLKKPVAYDLHLDHATNFIFLTGANMAGKSTFIKATGIAVFLAHIGMAVPAKNMQLTLFDGILSNINVVDNVIKGESYFFNEVQRIRNTIQTINNGKKWLVLIDELFKGTNVQDAMRCSTEVIQGLLHIKTALFILSTHLYEIADELKTHGNIAFRYFETSVENEQLSFSYQLLDGVSNDRLGYLILQREGVVDLLKSLRQ